MDFGGPLLLSNILAPDELSETPTRVQEKLNTYLGGFFDDYCKDKAAANRLHDYEKRTEELELQIQDYEAKLQNFNQNVGELRNQLDIVSSERARMLEEAGAYEKQQSALRLEKNKIADERDSLKQVIERQNGELERLTSEKRLRDDQFQKAVCAKFDAIKRVEEIESKEMALDSKERRFVQERTLMQTQIQTLTEDLNRNINELQNLRRDKTVQSLHLEARHREKEEELKIAQSQCTQYQETIVRLTDNMRELNTKLLNQNEESSKMIDYYKKELEAKSKLEGMYKSHYEDSVEQRSSLEAAFGDLKRMLSTASDEYGELETKLKTTVIQHELELEERDKIIVAQKAELSRANELLKEVQHESVENTISKLAPSAAMASRLIRTDMSLTEIYSLYVKTTEDLELQKRENARINLQLKTIVQELTENAPMLKKQELEYEKLIEVNNMLSQQCEEQQKAKVDMIESLQDAAGKINHIERENKKLRHSQADVSRQVVYLLKEVERLRNGSVGTTFAPPQYGSMTSTDEVISKQLVTFGSLEELQANNQKLMLLVRDMSAQLEAAELQKNEWDTARYQEKLDNYAKKSKTMQDTLNQQNNTIATLLAKCERYKKLYFGVQKQLGGNGGESVDISDAEDMDVTGDESGALNTSGASKSVTGGQTQRRVRDLEQQLQELKDHYKTLKEQHEYYAQEKKNNEKIMNEQFDSMRTEVRELTTTNCKVKAAHDFVTEQLKLQKQNAATYKQQIVALEERNKNYETTIVKHEQTVLILKDEVLKAQRGHSSVESEANHLRHENMLLKDTAGRLQAEKEATHREQYSQQLLLNNLELIKSNLERSETEGRVRLEQRLEETMRELSAQRRRFQEEEDRFHALSADLKRQMESVNLRMAEECAAAETLRAELTGVRAELAAKVGQVDELSKKLQESLTPSKNDNPIALANKKARELEVKCEEARIEIAALSGELTKAREHVDQYYKLSQSAETEIKNLHDVHTAYVAKTESALKQLQLSEQNLKSQLTQLQAEEQLNNIIDRSIPNQTDQLKKLQEELKDTLQKLAECNRDLRALRTENSTISASLNAVETKYANEMVLHSADIQELSRVKTQLTKIQDQINGLQSDRDAAKAAYAELKSTQDESRRLVRQERDELDERIKDLNQLNSNLHDQIEALTGKLSTLSQMQTVGTLNASANESIMETSDLSWNVEDEARSAERLLQVIKFLRKEKDLMVAKVDILQAENMRLQSEQAIQQKRIDELTARVNSEQTQSETMMVSATKHEEILRKIETMDAITDSNRILREERNTLSKRVKELNQRISAIESELFPLQNQNRELSGKIDELSSENTSLRTEAIKWRQRANVLVEKSNKNPEEFKRLQMERENLAKMLTTEKEALRQASEQIASMRTELSAHDRQLHTLSEDKTKTESEYAAQKQHNARLVQELMELKNKLLEREEIAQRLSAELDAKEAQLHESKNKEVQIRKIAKRYKDSYLEQLNKTNAAGGDAGGNSSQDGMELGAQAGVEAGVNAELEAQRASIENLNGVVRGLQAENEKMRRDVEDNSTLRVARQHIVSLQETNTALSTELENTKAKLLSNQQKSSENHDAELGAIKSQYEATYARQEKELADQAEDIARLTRDIEVLHGRITQLNRQLTLQQSTKPSTSSVAGSEKGISAESSPRTANVKPMSGSAGMQQSASVTPRRGGETPLASIRPISVQNSRTAAILPTSQQQSQPGGSATTSASSTAGTSSSTAAAASGSAANQPSSAGCSNTALVPPQQQVHTTGSSTLETMSSSPTSSHTDYMPSTSSAAVAVAAVPPMGSSAAAAAESSQEAESMQQPQPNESQQPLVSGGQQQVVALVSPRVEGSMQQAPSPNMLQHVQQEPNSQQPSTSGTTSSSTSHIAAVSSHSRHTPSSSSVTTSQAGSSGGHKRPRDGESSTSAEDGSGEQCKPPKRLRQPLHGTAEAAMVLGVADPDLDVEYQVPTSSQRDQEDDIIVGVGDSEEDEEEEDMGMMMGEADDGPADADAEHEGYEDSYEQDQDMDEEHDDCVEELNEATVRAVAGDVAEADNNNEVDVVDDGQAQAASCTSALSDQQAELAVSYGSGGASTSHQAAAAALAHSQQQDSQQSQAISSGSYEPSNVNQTNIPAAMQWKQQQQATTSSTLTRQQKATLMMMQQGSSSVAVVESASPEDCQENAAEIVSSPQGSKFGAYSEPQAAEPLIESQAAAESVQVQPEQCVAEDYSQRKCTESDASPKASGSGVSGTSSASALATTKALDAVENSAQVDEDYSADVHVSVDLSENVDSESHHSSGATQSEMQEVQHQQVEENEGADGVSSEGEKQAIEEIEEEGREAEATTSPPRTTRSKAQRGAMVQRRPSRGTHRDSRPTPIVWQESPGNSRNLSPSQRNGGQQEQQQPAGVMRGFPNQRAGRGRRTRGRPSGSNYGGGNMRYI